MTLPQVSETAKSSPLARLWLALLLATLMAVLAGPKVIAPASLASHLSIPTATLSAIQGRDLVSRKDAADTRLLVMDAPLSSQALPLFLNVRGTLSPAYYSGLVAFPGTRSFWARAPPSFA
jgi:hypothetical protein